MEIELKLYLKSTRSIHAETEIKKMLERKFMKNQKEKPPPLIEMMTIQYMTRTDS